jgi:hypothetical protein
MTITLNKSKMVSTMTTLSLVIDFNLDHDYEREFVTWYNNNNNNENDPQQQQQQIKNLLFINQKSTVHQSKIYSCVDSSLQHMPHHPVAKAKERRKTPISS